MIPKNFSRCLLPLAVAVILPVVGQAGEPANPAAPPATGKEVLVIQDSKDAQTFDAEGQDVTVNGSHNKVAIKGTCHALTVSGDGNSVLLDSVSSISITGTGNEIAWTKAADGERPQVTDLGKENKVGRVKSKGE